MEKFKKYTTDKNDDNSVNIRKVEIFKLGKHKGFPYTEEWAQKAIDNFNNQKEGDFYPPVIIGHNNGDEEKPVKGFMDGITLEGDTIITDIIKVPEEAFKKLEKREYPNRSIEVNPEKATITALALLGGTSPHHKLPIMEFGADPGGVVIEFAEESDLKTAIELDQKLSGIRNIWWKVQDFVDKIMFDKDKSEADKKNEIKGIITEGVEILGEEAANFQSYKQGESTMPEPKVVTFTEEQLNNAKEEGFEERFKEKFGKSYDDYVKESEAEAGKAKEARIKSFADNLKGRNIAPAIIDEMIVPYLQAVPESKDTTIKFKDEDGKEADLDLFSFAEKIFEELFKLDEKGALMVDFSEKAKSDSEPIESQFGEDDLEKVHEKAKEIAVEKSGQESGAKFNEEYKKAVFQLAKEKESK